MMTSSLKQLQERYGAALNEQLERALQRDQGALRTFYDMMRYQLGYVDEELEPITGVGGKRFRPALCLATCEAVGGRWEEALSVAAGIELLHNFSLIHDDIEDRDPARHHRPTVWKLWGEAHAINVGDAMFGLAWGSVLDGNGTGRLELARAFMDMSVALTQGQYLDMSFENRQDVTPDDYLQMISLKTGAIIAYSAWSGAFIGGAEERTRRALSTFGRELGKAFQIHDDVMGIWGSPSTTGKEAAKDLNNRKKTLPVLLALEHAAEREQRELLDFLRREHDDLGVALGILTRTGVYERSLEQIEIYREAAFEALTEAHIPAEWEVQLQALVPELTGQ